MSKIKSLVLGSAAAIVAIGGAQAADLPVKAKAVEYVKVCSLYGAGFYYIPGTDTCIRIGGYVRAEVTFGGAASDATYISGSTGNNDVYANYYTRSRIMMNVDTRTATEYGVVRTFGAFGPQFNSGNVDGPDTQAAGSMRVEAAFIQFAGFTFGRSASAYALPWNGYPGNINSTLMGGPNYDAGVNNIQYTWQFGNGVSASIGVDAQEQANRVGVYNGGNPGATTGFMSAIGAYNNAYQAGTAVDVVGNIRLDQAWGLIQLSAAAHQVTGNYYDAATTGNAGSIVAGHPSDKWGFAVTGALQLKNLPTGPGDDIKISGTYSEGALRYVLGQSGATPRNFVRYDGGDLTFAGVPVADGVFSGAFGGGIELTKAYGFNGAFNHNWNKNWSSSVFGSWSHVDYNGNATNIICNGAGTYGAGTTSCNPDFNISQLGLSTTWKPVKNLAFIAEGTWVNIKQNNVGATNGLTTRAGQTYAYGDQDVYSGILRVQRNF